MATGTFDLLHPGHVFYLQEARKLGGDDAKLMVVVSTDKTVYEHKRIPIVDQQQRAEMIRSFKGVDEVFVGYEDDPFRIVKEQKPDIIAIGPDQTFDPENLEAQLNKIGLDVKVYKINSYKRFELDSTCKIIEKIKKTHFERKIFDECE